MIEDLINTSIQSILSVTGTFAVFATEHVNPTPESEGWAYIIAAAIPVIIKIIEKLFSKKKQKNEN